MVRYCRSWDQDDDWMVRRMWESWLGVVIFPHGWSDSCEAELVIARQ